MKSKFLYQCRRKLQILAFDITSPEFMSKVYFRIVLKYKLNLDDPTTLNEKIQWLKLYRWPYDKNVIQCTDKLEVRKYIEAMGEKEILNELYFVWSSADQINWEELPNSFAIKCNHGCGYNIICKDKKELNRDKVIKQLKVWEKEDFSKFNAEPHYSRIKTKIICEKFLEGEVINYNIYVFNGKAMFFSVAGGLGDGNNEHLTYYYPDGQKAEFKNKSYSTHENKLSPLLPKMLETAEVLAKQFPLARVDLFDIDGKIVFSELTFTPGGD